MRGAAVASVFGIIGVVGCASSPPLVIAPPPPKPEVAVVPPAPLPAPEDPAVRARADAAVEATAGKLIAIAESCEKDWLEPSTVCQPSLFEPFATDYQAYYSEHPDSRADSGRIDSLTRLGGPRSNVPQIVADLTRTCEERCLKIRLPSLRSAAIEAGNKCFSTKGAPAAGDAVCKAFAKKVAATVRPSEAERWSDECYGTCEDRRREVRERIAFEARRPRTRAEAVACRARCEAKHGGGWCGTTLLACLGDCETKDEERAREARQRATP